MKVLIVEDENLLAKQLTNLIALVEPDVEIVGRTTSIQSTVHWLSQNTCPELIFMDIELADGQCFDIFTHTKIKTPVIFTTAYDEYALQAFKVNSVDYLLKPIKEDELKAALLKFKEVRLQPEALDMKTLLQQYSTVNHKDYKDRFLVKARQKMHSINTEDIAYFFTKNTLNFIVTKSNQKHMVDYTLDEIEEMVNPRQFFRANRQHVLAHDVINTVHAWFNGKLKVELAIKTDDEIIISRDKAPFFRSWLGE